MLYCIGKATRYKEMDTVRRVPYTGFDDTKHSQLRRATFLTVQGASQACIEATEFNPVGFVVLVIDRWQEPTSTVFETIDEWMEWNE